MNVNINKSTGACRISGRVLLWIVSVAAIALLSHCQSHSVNNGRLVKVHVISIGYSTSTLIPLQPWEAVLWEEAFDTVITEPVDLRFLEERVEHSVHRDSGACSDTRLLLLYYWNDGNVDTLNMARFKMGFHKQCYKLDTVLINHVKQYLPAVHVQQIDSEMRYYR